MRVREGDKINSRHQRADEAVINDDREKWEVLQIGENAAERSNLLNLIAYRFRWIARENQNHG